MAVHNGSGNNTWVDYPSTTTLITATTLENIENQLDRAPADLGLLKRNNSGTQSISAATNTTLTYDTSQSTTSHVTVTSGTVSTINTTGLYLLQASAADGNSTATALTLWIEVAGGGTRYASNGGGNSSASGFPSVSVMTIVALTATTQISVACFSSAVASFGGVSDNFAICLLRRT